MQRTLFQSRHTGFTLIEVMVSVSIFAIILTVGIGSLLTINNAYRKSQSERVVVDSLHFVLESMAREIRVGRNFVCSPNCTDANEIRFQDPDGATVRYRIEPVTGTNTGRIIKNANAALTDPAVVAIDTDTSRFIVIGADPADTIQPYVIIMITGTATVNNQVSRYTIQTSVSQRQLDVPPVTP